MSTTLKTETVLVENAVVLNVTVGNGAVQTLEAGMYEITVRHFMDWDGSFVLVKFVDVETNSTAKQISFPIEWEDFQVEEEESSAIAKKEALQLVASVPASVRE